MYDIIIIGAGTAGISAYKQAVKTTQNVLIINHGPWDTTCARVGCMPSKILISAAERAVNLKQIGKVGLELDYEIKTENLMPHLQQLRNRFTSATLKDVNSWPKEHKLNGQAKFIDSQTVEVDGQFYQSKSFIIAVGSTPIINPEWKTELEERLLSSDQIFELPRLPQSIAIVGSGVIALELAQAFNHLGVKTTVFARSKRVGILSSPDLQKLAQKTISDELNILFETLPNSVKKMKNGVKINFNTNQTEQSIEVDYLLMATGRESLLKNLALENIHADFNDLKNLPVNKSTKQLSNLPIFVTGDAYTNTPLQHEAAHEGKFSVQNCLSYPKVKNIKTLTPLGIMFSYPQMAIAGKSHKQLTDEKIKFVIGYSNYEKQGRALVLGENQGAIEIYIDSENQKLIGAELFISDAEHLVHLIAWMIDTGATLEQLLDKPYYHPTLQEGLRTALKHARRQLKEIH